MHKALYREYRPIVFEDMIGQNHIIKTLKNQIKEGSMSHAYLFCGTRGTGKTTTAKILSRAVNCDHLEDLNPCNKCSSCISILDNSNLDVVEIDAASNNSVDDIRELRETVKYTPSNSRYKVYIIDEVHMLSQGAFNALLKTLEEPPSHVIFILATTEPNKIPATILSRCQRFDFKRVSIADLISKMREICEKENIDVDEDSLRIIARNGQGSVRDSLSILDKCASFSSGKLDIQEVIDILGISDPAQLLDFAEAIVGYDIGRCMEIIDDYYMWGKDLKILAQDLIQIFRSMLMAKIFGNLESVEEYTADYRTRVTEISSKVENDNIVRVLNLLSELIDNMRFSLNQRMSFEIYMMKIATPAVDMSVEAIFSRLEKIEKMIEDEKINIATSLPENMLDSLKEEIYSNINIDDIKKSSEIKKEKTTEVKSSDKVMSSVANAEHSDSQNIKSDELIEIKSKWDKILNALNKDGKKILRAFLCENIDLKYINGVLYIIGSDDFSYMINRLKSEENVVYLENAFKKLYDVDSKIDIITKQDAEGIGLNAEISSNENVKNNENTVLNTLEKEFSDIIEYE